MVSIRHVDLKRRKTKHKHKCVYSNAVSMCQMSNTHHLQQLKQAARIYIYIRNLECQTFKVWHPKNIQVNEEKTLHFLNI